MRVTYFTESLPPNTDGVVKTLVNLVDTLQQENIEFQFFSPVKPDHTYTWSQKVKQVKSVPFFLYKDYKMGLPFFEGIKRQMDEFKPDLIHICSPTLLGVYGLNYATRNNIPVVTSYHTHFIDYFSYYGLSWLEPTGWAFLQWFHNKCKMTYAPSQSAINQLLSRGIRDVALWERGIELDKFSPKFRDMELRKSVRAENIPILLFVGRLINHKDLDVLAAADKILKAKGYFFKIVIVGDGPMRVELEERLPDAHYTGYQYGENLSKWYASADIFTFPSTTETFGNVILEAFASEIPAVGVNAGGVADIINHDFDGLIAQPKNPKDFAKNVERLLAHPDYRLKLGRQARKTAKRYSWREINRRLLENYDHIITASPRVKPKRALAA